MTLLVQFLICQGIAQGPPAALHCTSQHWHPKQQQQTNKLTPVCQSIFIACVSLLVHGSDFSCHKYHEFPACDFKMHPVVTTAPADYSVQECTHFEFTVAVVLA